MKRRSQKQTELPFRQWGGRRPGAGRKPNGDKPMVTHLARPRLSGREPLHVTLRTVPAVKKLRTKARFRTIKCALTEGKNRFGFRLVHPSVQHGHIHLIVEANDRRALSRGMQGLSIRIARAVNRAIGRKGSVFADRYHARVLATPRETRNAIAYVLNNARHHAWERAEILPPTFLDPFSSAAAFNGWRARAPAPRVDDAVVPPRTWLLCIGWRRRGLIDVDYIPGARLGEHASPRRKR